MLGQYVFAGMKQERLLFIVLIQHALFHLTTCPVLNSQECQRTGCALCATKVHHLKGHQNSKSAQRPSMSYDTTKKAVKLDTAICVYNQKATANDKLIECHDNPCMNGKFFHLSCMN